MSAVPAQLEERVAQAPEIEVKPFASFRTPPFERFACICDRIDDPNPVHRDYDYARQQQLAPGKSLREPITPAVALEALVWQSIRNPSLNALLRNTPLCTDISFKFHGPVYPDTTVILGDGQVTQPEGKPLFTFRGYVDGEEVLYVTMKFGTEYPPFSPTTFGNKVLTYDRLVTADDVASFDEDLRLTPTTEAPFIFAASGIPAALLHLSDERTGSPSGSYRAIDLTFFSPPSAAGEYRTDIFLQSKRGNVQKGFIYGVEGVTSQGATPIVRGSLHVGHAKDFGYEAPKRERRSQPEVTQA